jgi:methyl coenzyme M reductase gamma subunit
MKTLPAIGTRVNYHSSHDRGRKCSGIVMAHYLERKWRDEDTGEIIHRPHHVGIKVDAPLPSWWPYPDTDRFAPSILEVSLA